MTDLRRILICDDDQDILDMTSMLLEATTECTVETEINSLNIYERIEQFHPDVILLDIWMPIITGDQIAKALKNDPVKKHISLILFSASDKGKEIAEDVGADGFLAKPFTIDELVNKIQVRYRLR